jgi:hypothetical protein
MGKIGLLVLGLALVLGVSSAEAGGCGPVCGVQKLACLNTARMERLACKATCRDEQNRGECARRCADTYRTAKRTCSSENATCRIDCASGDGCLAMCGRQLGQCNREVARAAGSCRALCGRVPLDRGPCLGACAMAARLGTAGCRMTFRSCAAICEGSPSGAFLDPSAGLF